MDSHAIVISDREGRIHLWSPGAETLFGWNAAHDAATKRRRLALNGAPRDFARTPV